MPPTTLNSIMAETQNPTNIHESHEKPKAAATTNSTSHNAPYSFPCVSGVDMLSEEPPTRPEVIAWYVYGLCTYFVNVFLLPVLFPLMVAQRAPPPSMPAGGCHRDETYLYQMLVHHTIPINTSKLSPLHLTAISWFLGVLISAPLIPKLAQHLDHSYHQPLILGITTSLGAFICLLTGFFNTAWLFPFYIIAITISIISSSSVHTRHLALVVQSLSSNQTTQKIIVNSRMSLSSTAFGSVATAVVALFTYHMLRRADHLTSLWVVSIFCGLLWFLGFVETFFACRLGGGSSTSISRDFSYLPRLVGRLGGVFLSSLSSTCIFTSASLYIVGGLCMKPVLFLSLWMVYFMFASISLPAFHPIQLLVQADPVKMNLLGFMLSAMTAGFGFYFKNDKWHYVPIFLLVLVQSLGAGILNSFGKVMVLERTPRGKEGVFASWYEWVKMTGACAGFALTAVCPHDIRKTFGFSFLAVFIGIIVLIFGSEVKGMGRGVEEKESGSSENGGQSKEYVGGGWGSKLGEGSVVRV